MMDDKSNGSINKRLNEAKFLAKQIDLMRASKNKRNSKRTKEVQRVL